MSRVKPIELWCREAGIRRSYRSLDSLARAAGVHKWALYWWIRGGREPVLSSLLALADGLKLPVEPVARACAAARVRYLAKQAAEAARRDALKG